MSTSIKSSNKLQTRISKPQSTYHHQDCTPQGKQKIYIQNIHFLITLQTPHWRLEAECQDSRHPGPGAEAGPAVEEAAAAAGGEAGGPEAGPRPGPWQATQRAEEGVPGPGQGAAEVTRPAPGPAQCEDRGRGAGGHVGGSPADIGHSPDAGYQVGPLQPGPGPGEQRGQPRGQPQTDACAERVSRRGPGPVAQQPVQRSQQPQPGAVQQQVGHKHIILTPL